MLYFNQYHFMAINKEENTHEPFRYYPLAGNIHSYRN